MTFLSRRKLIGCLAASIGASVVPTWSKAREGDLQTEAAQALHERMTAALSPRASAEFVGNSYLKSLPLEHRNADHLVHEVCAVHGTIATLSNLSIEVLHTRLKNWISEDFLCGNTVSVEGWILSRTEAALSGLAATRPA